MCIPFKDRRQWAGVCCIIVVETVLEQKKKSLFSLQVVQYRACS